MQSCFSCIQIFCDPLTVAPAHQTPCPWIPPDNNTGVGWLCPPRDLPHPGAEAMSFTLPASAGGLFTTSTTGQDLTVTTAPGCTLECEPAVFGEAGHKQIISGWWGRQKVVSDSH